MFVSKFFVYCYNLMISGYEAYPTTKRKQITTTKLQTTAFQKWKVVKPGTLSKPKCIIKGYTLRNFLHFSKKNYYTLG